MFDVVCSAKACARSTSDELAQLRGTDTTLLGFVHSGTIAEPGFKFGRWLDVAFYQLKLDTPAQTLDS